MGPYIPQDSSVVLNLLNLLVASWQSVLFHHRSVQKRSCYFRIVMGLRQLGDRLTWIWVIYQEKHVLLMWILVNKVFDL